VDPLSFWLTRPAPDRAWHASLATGLAGALVALQATPWRDPSDGLLLLAIALLTYCPFAYWMLRPAADALSLYRVLRDEELRLTLGPDDIDAAALTMGRRMVRRTLLPAVALAGLMAWGGCPGVGGSLLVAYFVYGALLVYWALLASLTTATWTGVLGFLGCYTIMLAAFTPVWLGLWPGLAVVAAVTALARFGARFLAEPRTPQAAFHCQLRRGRRQWRSWLGAVSALYALTWLLCVNPSPEVTTGVFSVLAGCVGWLAIRREVLAGTLDLLRMTPLCETHLVDGWAGRGLLPAALLLGAVALHQPLMLLGVPAVLAGAYLGVLLGLEPRASKRLAGLALLPLLPGPVLAGAALLAAPLLRARCVQTLRCPA